MKITILLGAFFPAPTIMGGAVEKMWFELGKRFAAQGHDVTQISRRHPQLPEREQINGVRHIRVKGYDTPRSLAVLKLMDLAYTLRANGVMPHADILVSNTFWAPLFTPQNAGAIYVDVARYPKGQIRFYQRASRLRANSSPIAEAIIEQCPTASPRVKIIPNPLPFIPGSLPDFDAKEKRVLYVGRVHPEKGLDLLIRAFAASDALADWTLVVVGPWEVGQGGGGKSYLESLKQIADQARVEWVGPVFDNAQLQAQYERARVFAYPSVAEKGETFGLAPLEAMAWGCAPVVSALRCFQDFIRQGENGLVFDHRSADPVQACREMLEQAATHSEALGRAAVEVRTSHSLDKIAQDFLADFATLLENPR